MLSVLLLAAGLTAAQTAAPAIDSHTQAALDLIVASRTDETFEQMKNPTGPMVENTIAQFQGCASAKPVLDEFAAEMGKVSFSEAQIQDVRLDLAKVYAEVFSEAELKEMVRFFASPTGQKMLDKTPDVMQRGMAASQARTQATMQQAMQVAQGFGSRLEDAYNACAAAAQDPQ